MGTDKMSTKTKPANGGEILKRGKMSNM